MLSLEVEAVRILIEPNDVLLFRESKPFMAGEGHLARSVFPLPQAIAGALRSKILVDSNFSDEAKKLAGFEKDEPEFMILGHFLFFKDGKDEGEYFSTPLDITKAKGIDGYFFVKPLKVWNGKFIFSGKTIHFKSVGGYLSYDRLIDYLKGDLNENELEDVVKDDLIRKESRVGIKLGDGKITEEGYFYKAEFLRFNKNVKLSVWLGENGEKVKDFLGESGLIKLGGESRFAKFTFEDKNPLSKLEKDWDEIKEEINRTKRFKLYVATPLLIKDGKGRFSWNISYCFTNSENGDQKINIKIKKVYPLIGKPLTFSGWDYAENKPKPNRYAVPSGSVYFVEFDGKIDLEKPYLKLGELKNLGYGLCFMGVWI
jgi:CRISPR-associated protein Cmr3